MSNPAQELHEVLSKSVAVAKGRTIFSVRGGGTRTRGTELGFVQSQIRACWLLGETNRLLDKFDGAGEDMASFRIFLPQWWDAVVLPKENWSAASQTDRAFISAEALASLANFGAYIAKSTPAYIQVSSDSVAQSRRALDELLGLLDSDELRLNPEAQVYVFGLITEVRTLLEAANGSIDLDLVARIHELQGFLSTLANDIEYREADSKVAVRIRQVVRRITPVVLPVVGAAGYMLGFAADTMAITDALGGE
ncbi:hypothetical protein M2152_001598 [Microbacteriaceae bacterium SG_E_30_P1]|uniref:Uncharacterized protein n=2 Tax=Antiquaquibacter oligotrophicus TaxID=2880260 RepID=A0ABT6KN29_9MICO|nr:hypothetical protein [Antiquaquibacter oligotrophicus]MDH6181416.1 hypothetical protein [Antiquaquibacter oligotrophicus]